MKRDTFFSRLGHDGPNLIVAGVWSLMVAIPMAAVCAWSLVEQGRHPVVVLGGALLGGAGTVAFVVGGVLWTTGGVADGLMRMLWPSGASTAAPPSFSLQDAMVARGDVRGALLSLESLIQDRRTAPRVALAARMRAAELHAARAGDPHRARVLWEEARAHRHATPAQRLTATQRLVDLYLGPLRDPAAARAELRRIAEQHPGSSVAAHARTAIERLG